MESAGRRTIKKQRKVEDVSLPLKWEEGELKRLLHSLKVYGHKDLDSIKAVVGSKSVENIKKFLIVAHSQGRGNFKEVMDLKYWLDKCASETEKDGNIKTNDYYHPALAMKFLSVDGLVECHPKPEDCEGVDFAAAYRLIYQALMGYPLQPVNEATADLIVTTFNCSNTQKNYSLVAELSNFLKVNEQSFRKKDEISLDCDSSKMKIGNSVKSEKKQLVRYERKRPLPTVSIDQIGKPPLKVVVEENCKKVMSNLKCYSVTVGEDKNASTIAVPVSSEKPKFDIKNVASEMWDNTGFNPLKLSREHFDHKWSS